MNSDDGDEVRNDNLSRLIAQNMTDMINGEILLYW